LKWFPIVGGRRCGFRFSEMPFGMDLFSRSSLGNIYGRSIVNLLPQAFAQTDRRSNARVGSPLSVVVLCGIGGEFN
jgi:hypothetical protein